MKFWQFGRAALALTSSLGLALFLNSCGGGYTIAYLYVTGAYSASSTSAPTPITILGINSETGAVYPVANSTAPLNYTNPVAEVVSPAQTNLYVLCQGPAGSSPVVVQYGITNNGGNLNGDITPINTYNTSGTVPTSMAINSTGTYLYVVETYALNSQTNGDIDIFPVNSDGSLGTPNVVSLTNNQNAVGVTALPGTDFVYVASWNQADTNNPNGTVWGYQNTGGNLSLIQTTSVGLELASITSYASTIGSYLYVTDESQNCIFGYSPSSSGILSGITMSGCGSAGQGAQYGVSTNAGNGSSRPTALLVEPRGKYLFVANSGSGTIGGWVINQSQGGALSATSSATAVAGAQPTCLAIDPILGKYIFTADYLSSINGGNLTQGGIVSGFSLNSSTGALSGLQNGPFIVSTTLPSCVAISTTGSIPPPGSP
jgi:6-phosphogluconolactonase